MSLNLERLQQVRDAMAARPNQIEMAWLIDAHCRQPQKAGELLTRRDVKGCIAGFTLALFAPRMRPGTAQCCMEHAADLLGMSYPEAYRLFLGQWPDAPPVDSRSYPWVLTQPQYSAAYVLAELDRVLATERSIAQLASMVREIAADLTARREAREQAHEQEREPALTA
jgi:hypothetical protein